MNNRMIAFRILLSFAVLAAATVFMVRHSTLRQLNSARSRIEQQIVEWSNRRVVAAPAEGAGSVSTNAGLSTAEHSELLRLRGQIGVLRRDLAEETNQPAAATGAEAARAAHGTLHGQADVTAAVKALVAGGTNSIAAGNHLLGEDPASGVVKRLRVELRVDGAPLVVEADEGKTVDIPPGAEVVQAVYGNLRGQKRSSP
jgi:hypothetical protein